MIILINKEAAITVHSSVKDEAGRFIALDIFHGETRFTIANIYAPNFDSPGFFMNRFNQLEQFDNDLKIIAGDLNLVLDYQRDRKGNRQHPHSRASKFVRSYLQQENMVDV